MCISWFILYNLNSLLTVVDYSYGEHISVLHKLIIIHRCDDCNTGLRLNMQK